MPAQLYTFINDQDLAKKVFDELLTSYSDGTPVYVNISPDQSCFMPTFEFYDEISREPVMRLTFNTLAEPNQYVLNDLGLFLINKPIEVFFIEKQSIEGFEHRYRIGVDGEVEPNTAPTLQTMNKYGKVFSYVMDVEAISSEAIGKEIEGTVQSVSLSALPYEYNVFNNMDEVNEYFGFKKGRPVIGPNNLYQITGNSSRFTAPSELARKDKDKRGSCLVGRITRAKETRIVFGNTVIPCKIVWFLTGFGEIPFPVCANYDDYNDYQVGKYVMMFAFVKADFGQRGKSFEEMKTEAQHRI